MKRLALSLAAVLIMAGLSFAGPKGSKARTFRGEIMDSPCAAMGTHDKMIKEEKAKDAKECTISCVKMGGKYVLYNAARKTTYQLDDQEKPKEFAGQKVKVTGTYDSKTKTIRVQSIEAAS